MTQNFEPIEWSLPELDLNLRRSIFVYEVARQQAAAVDAPIIPEPWSHREQEFKDQFLELMERYCAMPELPTPEEAHNSWWDKYIELGWVYGEVRDPVAKTHPDMVPFDQLGYEEQIKDAVFLMLVELARDYIKKVD